MRGRNLFGCLDERLHAVVLGLTATVLSLVLLLPNSPASPVSLICFVLASVAFAAVAFLYRPSVYIVTLALFLTLGFLAKLIMHFGFAVQLTEAVGLFGGSSAEWNRALDFATAGLVGATIATVLAHRWLSRPVAIEVMAADDRHVRILVLLLCVLLLAALATYAINREFVINRIGYTPTIKLSKVVTGVLNFVIAWGALLGALTLVQWLVEARRVAPAALIYVASVLGFFAAVTMGSRVQLLLYVYAGLQVVLAQRPPGRPWLPAIVALFFAGAMFISSLAIVSIERDYAFSMPLDPIPSAPVPKPDPAVMPDAVATAVEPPQAGPSAVTSATANAPADATPQPKPHRSLADMLEQVSRHRSSLVWQLRMLVVMRWVGLEGVMTMAARDAHTSFALLGTALLEHPSVGTQAAFQKIAGTPYATNTGPYVFLTLPGPLGFAGFSGAAWFVGVFMFAVVLVGHLIERYALFITQSIAAAAVTGTALAYLTVQLNIPWTLIVFIGELIPSLAALGLIRYSLVQRTTPAH